MATVYYDADADLGLVQARKVAVLGYGAQGEAHARNLRDSGCEVRVGLRAGSRSAGRAVAAGLPVATPAEAAAWADLVALLLPDADQPGVFAREVAPHLKPGDALLFAHGFSIHFGQLTPPDGVDVVMVAPKGPGAAVREQYRRGRGVPVLLAVAQDTSGKAWDLAKAYARAIGGTRAGALVTTFQEETETALFGAQAVLGGGVATLARVAFDALVAAGHQPEVAYLECVHQLGLAAELLQRHGPAGLTRGLSEVAEYGAGTRGPRLVGEATVAELGRILGKAASGAFAREWLDEHAAGRPTLARLRESAREHAADRTGRTVRAGMPWLDEAEED
jgi:ketol-acid reductoisomerase